VGYSETRNPKPDQNLFGNDGSGTAVYSEDGSATLVFLHVCQRVLFLVYINTVSPLVVDVEHRVDTIRKTMIILLQFAPSRGIYFSLKITVTVHYNYGIFKMLVRVRHYQFSSFFVRFSVYQIGLKSEREHYLSKLFFYLFVQSVVVLSVEG
jgi:hypothetical protein